MDWIAVVAIGFAPALGIPAGIWARRFFPQDDEAE